MIRHLKLFFPAFLFSFSSLAQNQDSIKIVKLQAQIAELTELVVQEDSAEYDQAMELLANGFHNSYLLQDKISTLGSNISNQQVVMKMLNLNNPGTSQMISQFEQYMKNLVETRLSAVFGNDNEKKNKVFRILENIFRNPVIAPILNSNPISGAISSAYNIITSIIEPSIKVEKTMLNNVKDVKLSLNNLVDKLQLDGLAADFLPYIRFFDTLYYINNQFSNKMVVLRQRAKALSEGYRPVWQYYKNLGLRPEETPVWKNRLFEEKFPGVASRSRSIDRYAQFLHKPGVREALKFSGRVLDNYNSYNELAADFNSLLTDFKVQYIGVLRKYKDELSIYSPVLRQTYAELTAVPEVVNALVVNDRVTIPDPDTQKVLKAQLPFQWVDSETMESLKNIF
jgi:hypothetical protein